MPMGIRPGCAVPSLSRNGAPTRWLWRCPSVNATTAAAFDALPGASAASTTMTQRSGLRAASVSTDGCASACKDNSLLLLDRPWRDARESPVESIGRFCRRWLDREQADPATTRLPSHPYPIRVVPPFRCALYCRTPYRLETATAPTPAAQQKGTHR